MMFSTYKQAILSTYKTKAALGSLPLRLTALTPRNIQEELIQYLSERFDSAKDKKTLSVFFGEQQSAAEYVRVVSRTEVDKFKPVINFLKGITTNPDDKHVHLAALLVDFQHRPYEVGKDYTLVGNQEYKTECKASVQNDEKTDCNLSAVENLKDGSLKETEVDSAPSSRVKGKDKGSVSRLLYIPHVNMRVVSPIILLFSLAAIVVYTLSSGSGNSKQCMYWKEDHYEAVACDALMEKNVYKIALDTFLLEHFKKITRVDTITERSIGKIWYLKHRNAFEFFTVGGEHPVHRRKLSRLSSYIFKKELVEK